MAYTTLRVLAACGPSSPLLKAPAVARCLHSAGTAGITLSLAAQPSGEAARVWIQGENNYRECTLSAAIT